MNKKNEGFAYQLEVPLLSQQVEKTALIGENDFNVFLTLLYMASWQ